MATNEIDIIKARSQELPQKQKVELIEFLTGLLEQKPHQPKMIEYGKYANSGRRMSTEEDFKIAEWHPSDEELNGN
ncbi:MAG: hypothetical protein IPM59_14755 [Chloracidobacterium sp.]|nr:hypothetical protein [Chloracidobacterium sp.]